MDTLEGFCTNTKKSNLEVLFYDFWKMANDLGANSFYIDEFSYSTGTILVIISIFNLTEKELDDNYALYPYNKIYVFGDLITSNIRTKIPKSRNIKINQEKIKIFPLSYYEYQSDINERVNVTVGSIFGSGYIQTGEIGKPSVYLSVTGGKIRPFITPMGGGLSFSNGDLNLLDISFGRFLSVILEKSEDI